MTMATALPIRCHGAGHDAKDLDALPIRKAHFMRGRQHRQVAGGGPLRDEGLVLGAMVSKLYL